MDVPEWRTVALSDCCVPNGLQTGPFGGQLHQYEYTVDGVPVVMPKDMISSRIDKSTIARIPETKANELSKHRCVSGDILFARRGDIGRVALVTEAESGWLCGTGSLRARLSHDVDSMYMTYAVSSPASIEWLTEHAVGQTMLNLNTDTLGRLPLAVPPLPEQRKIAAILSSVDEAIEKTQAVIDQVQVVKKGLMAELLTMGLPGRHEKFKQTEIGTIPESWEVVELDDLVDQTRPVCYGILKPGTGFPNGVPVVKVKDIKNGKISEADLLLTSPDIDQQYRRSRLRAGDILLTIRGTPGRLAMVPASLENANITQDTARIAVLPNFFSAYVRRVLESPMLQAQISDNTVGQAVKGINIGAVRKLRVPLPALQEQCAIADAIDSFDVAHSASVDELMALRTLKSALMQSLLTGQIRVTP